MPVAVRMASAGSGTEDTGSALIDPVPATFLSGSWIQDDASSEWTLTANNGAVSTMGTVTGNVIVFPVTDPIYNCPTVTYQASGWYTPSSQIDNVTGSTSFTWTATSPSPSNTCGGYTPVSSMTFTGTIANKGNDYGFGSWSNSSGGTGALTVLTNLLITPTK